MSNELLVAENQLFSGLCAEDIVFLRDRLGGRLQFVERALRIVRVVGHIVLPSGLILRIRSPKSSSSALLAWIAYVDSSLRSLIIREESDRALGPGEFGEMLAQLFLDELEACLRHGGLIRGYRRETARGGAVRGAIDFCRIIRDGHDLSRVTSTVWVRRNDTPLNRVFAAALERVRRDPLLQGVAPELLYTLLSHFTDVPPLPDPALVDGRILLARTETSFQHSFELARLLLIHGGMSDGASHRGFSFLIDLERLFEGAVQRAFVDSSFTECTVQAPLLYRRRLDRGSSVARSMFVDILINDGKSLLVVDAKFKAKVSSANIQQMVAYATMTGARRGALVLPGDRQRDGSIEIHVAGDERDPLCVRVVHFDTSARDVASWRRTAADLVSRAFGQSQVT